MTSMYQVCDLVMEKFDRLGRTVTGLTRERIISAGGRYVGEAFRAGDLKAEWLFDHDVLVIHRGGYRTSADRGQPGHLGSGS